MCALAQLLMASRRKRCIELTFAPFEGVLRNPFFVRQKPPKRATSFGDVQENLSPFLLQT